MTEQLRGSNELAPPASLREDSRILVVKLADIGDMLLATPALRLLRESYPKAHLAALVQPSSAEVLRGSTLVDELILFDQHRYDSVIASLSPAALWSAARELLGLRQKRFDCLLLFHHMVTDWGVAKYAALCLASGAPRRVGLDDGRAWFLTNRVPDQGFGARHEAEYMLALVRAVGAEGPPGGLELPIGATDREFASQVLRSSVHPRVAIHPGSGTYSLARRWPASRFAEVADRLALEEGVDIVLVGGPTEVALAAEVKEHMRAPALDLSGRTTLRQLAAVLEQCDLLVGNDSGVVHVAVAAGTPVVAIFGPTNHRAWAPYQPSMTPRENRVLHRIVRINVPCSPCLYRGHRLGRRQGCPNRDCLRLLMPSAVVAEAQEALRYLWRHGGKSKRAT